MADENNTTVDTGTTGTDTGGAPAGGDSLHDDISRAFDVVESRDAPPEAPLTVGSPTSGASPATPAPGARVRDTTTGRFLPGGAEAPAKPAAAPVAAPDKQPLAAPPKPLANGDKPPVAAPKPAADPAAPAAPALRAPASWKPGAREHWSKLPVEVQQEVSRREAETAKTVHESARAREALTHVQQVIAPFAQNIAASGVDALTVMSNLFNADNMLRHGSTSEKAGVIANIIKSYGVDLQTLDALLAGQQPASDPASQMADRLRREMREQLQPVMSFVNSLQGRREAELGRINQNAATDVQSFGAENEFFEDVRVDMADIIDMYTQRGVSISLQDAYEKAIKINPHVSEIIAKRAESERANAAAQAAQRARRTAVSLSSAPAPAGAAPGPASDDRRGAIEAAWESGSQQ